MGTKTIWPTIQLVCIKSLDLFNHFTLRYPYSEGLISDTHRQTPYLIVARFHIIKFTNSPKMMATEIHFYVKSTHTRHILSNTEDPIKSLFFYCSWRICCMTRRQQVWRKWRNLAKSNCMYTFCEKSDYSQLKVGLFTVAYRAHFNYNIASIQFVAWIWIRWELLQCNIWIKPKCSCKIQEEIISDAGAPIGIERISAKILRTQIY